MNQNIMQKKIPSSNYADMLTVAEWELSSDAIDKLNLLNSCPELLKEARKFREEKSTRNHQKIFQKVGCYN